MLSWAGIVDVALGLVVSGEVRFGCVGLFDVSLGRAVLGCFKVGCVGLC
jgi:hypothetical protein